MKKVIIESPYKGNVKINIEYARMCVRDSLNRGEAPIASHLLYTQEGILRDEIPKERQLGIDAGLAWTQVADEHVFYIDYGYSEGMKYAMDYVIANNIPYSTRKIWQVQKRIFIICTVRNADDEYRLKLENYVESLEKEGIIVHLPHRDTNQNATGIEICTQNKEAIENSDEVHIFYNSKSTGTHFDMGVAFALSKPITIVENEKFDEGKSFSKMLTEWRDK